MKISEILDVSLKETASAGGISSANVSTGPVYKNKKQKFTKGKLIPNALDTNTNLITGGSIVKRR